MFPSTGNLCVVCHSPTQTACQVPIIKMLLFYYMEGGARKHVAKNYIYAFSKLLVFPLEGNFSHKNKTLYLINQHVANYPVGIPHTSCCHLLGFPSYWDKYVEIFLIGRSHRGLCAAALPAHSRMAYNFMCTHHRLSCGFLCHIGGCLHPWRGSPFRVPFWAVYLGCL